LARAPTVWFHHGTPCARSGPRAKETRPAARPMHLRRGEGIPARTLLATVLRRQRATPVNLQVPRRADAGCRHDRREASAATAAHSPKDNQRRRFITTPFAVGDF